MSSALSLTISVGQLASSGGRPASTSIYWMCGLRHLPPNGRTSRELPATELLLNASACADSGQHTTAREAKILLRIQDSTGLMKMEQNGDDRISSAVLSTTQPPLRGGGRMNASRRYVNKTR